MKNSSNLFLIVQGIAWFFFMLANITIRVVLAQYSHEVIWATLIAVFFGFAYSTLFGWLIHHKLGWKDLAPGQLFVRGLVAGPLVAIIWTLSFIPLQGLISGELSEYGAVAYLGNMVNLTLIMYVWMLSYFAYNFFRRYKASEIRRWKLEAAVKEAELNSLKLQINPHFMFNALNNIRALILENPQNARKLLTNLSDIMRYSLNHNKVTLVPLASELEIVENYLELVSIQYEDKLQQSIEVEQGLLREDIPPMMIQLLVENAIKHGISQLPGGGKVLIKVFRQSSDIVVEVRNSGQLNTNVLKQEKSGIGLQNLKDRLALLYENHGHFDLRQIDDQVIATIVLSRQSLINPS